MKTHSIKMGVASENFETARAFIEKRLSKSGISKEIRMETMLVFEALLNSLIAQGFDKHTELTVKTERGLGETRIDLGFEGAPFAPAADETEFLTPEDSILMAYDDKVDYRYQSGYNHIHIAVRRSAQNALFLSLAAILVAILAYIPIHVFLSPDARIQLGETIVFPLVKLYANAMLMVGAPVTFFSLLKNFTDIYIVSEKNSVGRRMQAKTIITSVIAVVLAVGAGFLIAAIIRAQFGDVYGSGGINPMPPLPELIESMVPSSIFTPFETIMPFPLIFVALVVTYAFCSVGKYFDKLKGAVDACYTLFSRMLHGVMVAFPIFCFLALLYPLLGYGFPVLVEILYLIGLSAASLVILAVFYLVRLLIGGVKPGPFFKHLPGILRENYSIGSVIDAVPFNVRYCARHYGMDRKRITDKLTILAQINLDGNCYLIMLMAMLFMFIMGSQASWFHIVVIGIMVVFLSFGAPNQPGSILIGTLIIALFLKADGLIPTAIYLEVFFGSLQNIINVTGDLVTVAIEEKHVWK